MLCSIYKNTLKNSLVRSARQLDYQGSYTTPPLFTVYKFFIRLHPHFGNITYEKAYNASFHQNLDKIQYNSALAITGAIKVTSKEDHSI